MQQTAEVIAGGPKASSHVVVLHVEDDRVFRVMFNKMMLSMAEDVEVIEAGGVLEAINILGMRPDIDVVILDHFLPIFSARDVRDYAKKLGKKVMYLTGGTTEEVLEDDPEATQILKKSGPHADLKQAMSKMLDEVKSIPTMARKTHSVSFLDNFMRGIGTKKEEDVT
jgi:CheY-like chemotaxis protein